VTAVLKVKDDGAWRTVVEPYVNVDGTWKTVHNIWIKHGDTWRLAHKTAFGRYIESSDSGALTSGGSITIASSVRYIKVRVSGSGGGAASGIATRGSWGASHMACPQSNGHFASETAAGGNGGGGGLIEVVLEVTPGETYTYTYNGPGSGGSLPGTFDLWHNVVYTVGYSGSGNSTGPWAPGGLVSFQGPNNTSLISNGGLGGAVGQLTVSAVCSGSGFQAQNVSVTNGAAGAAGTTVIQSDNLVQTNSNTAGGGGAGGTGGQNAAGNGGSGGSIQIWQYKASNF
jgi:hypothetical protein